MTVAIHSEDLSRSTTHIDYWRVTLADANPNPIPYLTGAPATGQAVSIHTGHLDVALGDLRRAADSCALPARALLTAAHLRVLGSLTSNPEVATAVDYADRDQTRGPALVPLRVRLDDLTWADLGREALRLEADSAPHRSVPYRQIMETSPHLVLDSRLTITEDSAPQSTEHQPHSEPGYVLCVDVVVDSEAQRIRIDVACDQNRIHPSLCTHIAAYFGAALASIAADPSAVASRVDLRPPAERATVAAWRSGPSPHSSDPEPLYALFRRQAQARPHATAVCDINETLTYRELDDRVDAMARRLRSTGVTSGHRVGVCVLRSVDLVVTLLAVMAAGAAYVPLDPDFPAARLEFIAADAALQCLVTGPGMVVPVAGVATISVVDADPPGAVEDGTGTPAVAATDAAYVMYTSGSTGRPKGTVIEHRNLATFFTGMDQAIGISPADRVLAVTSVSFDISVLEILWPLVRGASTVICPERMIDRLSGDDSSLEGLIRRYRPSLFQATPSFFTGLTSHPQALTALSGLRALLIGGEALPRGLAQHLVEALPGVRILNMYGPTETTIWSLTHELAEGEDLHRPVAIGRPIADTTVRVVDALGHDACIGVPGELWIGGRGVARGYFRRPGLDRERFVTVEDRYYRTGDQVRWQEDGDLEFLGRNDRQVKLRGHRIELDEVESVLSQHPDVEAVAVVVTHHAERGDELVAYVRPRPQQQATPLVDQWRDLWDANQAQPGESFPGWVDSYTRDRIPAQHMRDWRASALARVRRLQPRRIVDVGAGAGDMILGLRPDWSRYLAIDISAAGLATAKAAAEAVVPHLEGVEYRLDDALSLGDLPDDSADLVILNSLVQYFPNAEYLTRVLDEAVRVVGPRGAVFVGDVRDLRLLPMFHADVALHRSPPLRTAAALAAAVDHLVRSENELCLAPQFFDSWQARHDGLGLRLECVGSNASTEMSRFRWDVTLFGPDHPCTPRLGPVTSVHPWTGAPGPIRDALAALADRANREGDLRITDVPNARLVRPDAVLRTLTEATPTATAWDIARSVWMVETDHAVDPTDVAQLGAERGLDVQVEPARSGRLTCLDISFRVPGRQRTVDLP